MQVEIKPQQDEEMVAISCEESLKTLLGFPMNQACSECTEPEPTWAFFLENPIEEDGPKLGVLCCYKCYGNHMRLGLDVGKVISTRRTVECKLMLTKLLSSFKH